MRDDSEVKNEIILLHSAVDCEILSPKGRWKAVVNKIDEHIEALENKVEELLKIQNLKVLDSYKSEGEEVDKK